MNELQTLENNKQKNQKAMLVEFVSFLKCYEKSKHFLSENCIYDAYSQVLQAMQHWAGIAILEEGEAPHPAIWKQIADINHGIYKLYEELCTSNETVQERIELVLLASDFSVMSRIDQCCTLLIECMRNHGKPLTAAHLAAKLHMAETEELLLVLNKLADRRLIRKESAAENSMNFEDMYTI